MGTLQKTESIPRTPWMRARLVALAEDLKAMHGEEFARAFLEDMSISPDALNAQAEPAGYAWLAGTWPNRYYGLDQLMVLRYALC